MKLEPIVNGWQPFVVNGRDAILDDGVAVTKPGIDGPPEYWFSGDSTIILGAADAERRRGQGSTVAHWDIDTYPEIVRRFGRGFVLIACLRYFGGLHSTRKNSRANVWLNDAQIDGLALRVVPENHSDFFHRPPLPDVSAITSFRDCQTIYAWPFQRDALSARRSQAVRVAIERDVRWDIDYVALLIMERADLPRVFLSHSWADKPTARLLATRLADRGIRVWLDEDEIKIGDSLIEKIREAIDVVEYVVVLLSETSVRSEWVRREVDVAMNQEIDGKRVKVLPVRLDECDFPGFLLGKLYADLRREDQTDSVVEMIERRLQSQR